MAIGKVTIDLEARVSKLEADLSRASKQVKKQTETMAEKAKTQMKKFGAAFAGVGVAFGALIQKTVNSADELGKFASRIGISTEALSQYRLVAERSGVAFGTLQTSFQRMTRRVAEAAAGTGEARAALKELGLDAQRLAQLAPDQQFEAIAEAMQGVTTQGDRVRLAMKLFDTEGVAMLQTMEGGAAAIRKVREEADAMGLTLSQDAAAKAAEFNDAITNLKASFGGASQQIITDLLPALLELARWFESFAKKIPDVIEGIEGFAEAIAEAVHGSDDPLVRLNQQIIKNIEEIERLEKQALAWAEAGEINAKALEDLRAKQEALREVNLALLEENNAQAETIKKVAEATEEQADATDQVTLSIDRVNPSIEEFNQKLERNRAIIAQGGGTRTGGLIGAFIEASNAVATFQANMGKAAISASELESAGSVLDDVLENLINDAEGLKNSLEDVDWAGFGKQATDALGLIKEAAEGSPFAAGGLLAQGSSLLGSTELFKGVTGAEFGAGLGQGLQVGGAASSIVGSGSEDGAAIGAALGAVIGSIIPGIGTALGAMVGGALGAFVDGKDDPRSQIQFGTGGPTAGTDAFRNTQLGSFNVRSGVDGFMRQLQQPVVQGIERLFDAFEQVLTPEQLANAGQQLSGLTLNVDAQSFNSGAVLEQIFDRVIRVTDPFVQRLVQPFEGIENKVDALQAAQKLFQTINADPLTDFQEALDNASLGVVGNIQRLGQAARDVASDFNGSIHSMESMTASLDTLNQAFTQSLQRIEAARQNITAITGNTIDNLRFAALGDDQLAQFDFLKRRADQLAAEIQTATDPAEIQRLVSQINQLTQQAVNIGGQVEGRDVDFEGTIDFLNEVDAAAQERLDLLQDRMVSVYDQAIADIKDTLGFQAETVNDAVGRIGNGATEIGNGGRRIQEAAQQFRAGVNQLVTTPLQVAFTGSAINA